MTSLRRPTPREMLTTRRKQPWSVSEENPFKFTMAHNFPHTKNRSVVYSLFHNYSTHPTMMPREFQPADSTKSYIGYEQNTFTAGTTAFCYPHRGEWFNINASSIAKEQRENQNTDEDIDEMSDLETDLQIKKISKNERNENASHNHTGEVETDGDKETSAEHQDEQPNSASNSIRISTLNGSLGEKSSDPLIITPVVPKKYCKAETECEKIPNQPAIAVDLQEQKQLQLKLHSQAKGDQLPDTKTDTKLSPTQNVAVKASEQSNDFQMTELTSAAEKKLTARQPGYDKELRPQLQGKTSDRRHVSQKQIKRPCPCNRRRCRTRRYYDQKPPNSVTDSSTISQNVSDANKNKKKQLHRQSRKVHGTNKKDVKKRGPCLIDEGNSISLSALADTLQDSSDDELSDSSWPGVTIDSSWSNSEYYDALDTTEEIDLLSDLESDQVSIPKQERKSQNQVACTVEREHLRSPTHRIFYDILQGCQNIFKKTARLK